MKRKQPKKLTREELTEVVKNALLVSIDLVVKNDNGEILVGFRTNEPAKGFWFVPGGRILKEERIAQAFERIACDELGISHAFEDAHFLGVFEHLYPKNFTEKEDFSTHCVVLAYEIRTGEAPLNLLDEQHSEYKWLDKESDKKPGVHPYTKAYFDWQR